MKDCAGLPDSPVIVDEDGGKTVGVEARERRGVMLPLLKRDVLEIDAQTQRPRHRQNSLGIGRSRMADECRHVDFPTAALGFATATAKADTSDHAEGHRASRQVRRKLVALYSVSQSIWEKEGDQRE